MKQRSEVILDFEIVKENAKTKKVLSAKKMKIFKKNNVSKGIRIQKESEGGRVQTLCVPTSHDDQQEVYVERRRRPPNNSKATAIVESVLS